MTKKPIIQVLSNLIWIAEATHTCQHCSSPTSVYGFLLNSHYDLESEDDATDEIVAKISDTETPCFMSVPTFFSKDGLLAIQDLTESYREDFSQKVGHSYWMNHCDKCGSRIEDSDIFEQDGPLDFRIKDKALGVKFHYFQGYMEAECHRIVKIPYLLTLTP